jgi:SAM-dependent methyltransferase
VPADHPGFPVGLVALLRCPGDGAPLSAPPAAGAHVRDGELRCEGCARRVAIAGGVVRMLEGQPLEAEERHEVALRDAQAASVALETEQRYWAGPASRGEVAATLAALRLHAGVTAADFGCGRGRYTTELAGRCAAVLAVDFSLESLRWMVRVNLLPPNVGLVHADITRLRLSPARLDRVLATTPLDTREQRLAMHHLASDALADDGRYVFSTEHYDLRSRLRRAPRAQRYKAGDNLFFRFTRQEMEREPAPYFARVRARPIVVKLPLQRRMPPALRRVLSRAAERVPVLRELGDLLLVQATRPTRAIVEDGPAPSPPLR